eukprot:scaffold59995_cov80-Phaeocystis_antarctica.AAC.1
MPHSGTTVRLAERARPIIGSLSRVSVITLHTRTGEDSTPRTQRPRTGPRGISSVSALPVPGRARVRHNQVPRHTVLAPGATRRAQA